MHSNYRLTAAASAICQCNTGRPRQSMSVLIIRFRNDAFSDICDQHFFQAHNWLVICLRVPATPNDLGWSDGIQSMFYKMCINIICVFFKKPIILCTERKIKLANVQQMNMYTNVVGRQSSFITHVIYRSGADYAARSWEGKITDKQNKTAMVVLDVCWLLWKGK